MLMAVHLIIIRYIDAIFLSVSIIYKYILKVNGWGGAVFSENRNSPITTSPQFISCTFEYNYAGINGGGMYWYNGVAGTIQSNTFSFNTAIGKGGGYALINSIATATGNTNTGNTANGDSSTADIYDEAELLYTAPDLTLSIDIPTELASLYTVWNTMLTEADLYPFNAGDSLCYVAGDNAASTKDGSSWSKAYNDIQDCLNALSNTNGGEIWVKTDTYFPSTAPAWKYPKSSSTFRSYEMFDNIRMYGGFSGTETSRYNRNWRDNPTYLSGQQSGSRQSNQLITAADGCLVDGFIFINAGRGLHRRRRLQNSLEVNEILTYRAFESGAGIYSNSTTISVVNTIFYNLYSGEQGGAVYCIGLQGETGITKSPTFINVAFIGIVYIYIYLYKVHIFVYNIRITQCQR